MCNTFKSDNEEIKINDKADEVIENHFKLLLNRYENNLETSVSGSDLFFCYIKNFIKQIQIVVDWIKKKKQQ